ncbi:hypothetical protein CDV55_107233 [Aspergillus turcosus]|nr:hypothetical protein KXV56_003732 [Aspergillus fumigatus]RHZ66665.1 hypothetical protein CDV55_107233 [Aspergillus turcosus]
MWSGIQESLLDAKVLIRRARILLQGVFPRLRMLYGRERLEQRWLEQLQDSVNEFSEVDVLPAAVPGGVPSVSYISDDIFDFGGLVDMTGCSFGQQRSNSMDQEVFFSFPIGWTSGMKDVYMALSACRASGHVVKLQELALWVGLPEEEVEECLGWLSQAGKVVSVGEDNLWTCV